MFVLFDLSLLELPLLCCLHTENEVKVES